MEDQTILPEKKDPFAALRYREFRSYIGMRFFFTFAYQMQAVVIGFHIFKLTKDPLALAFIGLCEAIPAISIALYGGYIADKYEKKGLLLKIFFGVLLASVVMLVFTSDQMHQYMPKTYILAIMYAMIFCIGLAEDFSGQQPFRLWGKSYRKNYTQMVRRGAVRVGRWLQF